MKTSFLFLCVFALALFDGCATQDTTKLHIGMTKKEVIEIMGNPDGAGTDGPKEYLVYQLPAGADTRFRKPQFESRSARPTPSGAIPKDDYANSSTEVRYEKYAVVLERGKTIAFGTPQQLQNEK